MKTDVGDWVLFESYGMKFAIGEVVYIVDEYEIVVKLKDQWKCAVVRRDNVGFAGNRKQVLALQRKVDAMMKVRHEAMQAAEDKVTAIAGEHAGTIRKLMRDNGKERDD
jgi:hypothetical protein